MDMGYLGGCWPRDDEREPLFAPSRWDSTGAERRLVAGLRGDLARRFTWGDLCLLIRGHARPRGATGAVDLETIAEELRACYLDRGDLAVDGLDGSFTLALLDARAQRVILYRNLVGAGFTYYCVGPSGLRFGSNLAELVEHAECERAVNRDALPAFFLFRTVPGRETLFDGFYRLMPGEQVTWDPRGLRRMQRETLGRLRTETITTDALARLADTTARVLADCAAHRPGAVNLLSGGVDSSYLQAAWNQLVASDDPQPASFSICVDHPRSWPDTDYAVSAARVLGTRHTLIPADAPYPDYLIDAIAATGEPPNHVQSAYFGQLGRELAARRHPAALCGEGADSLFGLGLANQIHNAEVARLLLPGRGPRRLAAGLLRRLGWPRLAATFRLASTLHAGDDLAHPINQVATFTDLPAVEACFGAKSVHEAAAARRTLLDQYEAGDSPMDRLHAAGFLGEAMDSASLWATLFQGAGVDLLCPFLDSRMLRLALNLAPSVRYPFRKPKDLLKRALADAIGPAYARRPKLGFGQPIFEWLSPGGSTRSLAEQAGRHDFVDAAAYRAALARPNWFLYSLVCFDVWHRLFIERSLPRPRRAEARTLARAF